jgi:biopolymer transport protein ExbB
VIPRAHPRGLFPASAIHGILSCSPFVRLPPIRPNRLAHAEDPALHRYMKQLFNTKFVLWTGLATAALAFPALAQEAGSEKVAGHQTRTLWNLFEATGFVGWLMLLTFTVGLGLLIENMMSLRKEKLGPPALIDELETLVEENNLDEALALCQSDGSYLANVTAGGLVMKEAGYEEMIRGLEQVSMQEQFKLNQKISYLSLIGNIGPLLGLLGTVTGMISSFQEIEKIAAPTPAQLSKGVYESLVNTTMGLFTGICFLTSYFLLKNKVTNMSLTLNLMAIEILKKAHIR